MDFIREAGLAVYLVLVAGVLSTVWAVQYARERNPQTLTRLIVLSLLTLMCGAFATATGLQASVYGLSRTPEKWLFLIGLREALNNFVLALGFVIVNLLLMVVLPDRKGARPALGRLAERA
jgi:di/tricarboxylate transporter